MLFNKPFRIKETSVFWHFYRKYYEIAGLPVVHPTNLCPYFWTAVNGFRLWLRHQMSLKPLLLATLIAIILSFIVRPVIMNTKLGDITIILSLLILIVALPVTLLIFSLRAKDFVDAWFKKHPRVQIVLGVVFVAAVVGFAIYSLATSGTGFDFTKLAAKFWEATKLFLILSVYTMIGMLIIRTIQTALKRFPKTNAVVTLILLIPFLAGLIYFALPFFTDILQINMKWLLYITGGFLALLAVIGLVIFLSRKTPNKLKENITNSTDTVMAFIKAKKNKVCPPVEALNSFIE